MMPTSLSRFSPAVLLVLSSAALGGAVGCGGGGYYEKSGAAPYPQSPHSRVARDEPSAMPPAPPPAQGQAAPVAVPAEAPKQSEGFKDYGVNPFVEASKDRLSTFSIDVDTASYSFARRALLQEGRLPPFASVRAEEYLNSFDYGYATPDAQERSPFKVHFAAAPSPLTPGHHLVRVGVQAKRVTPAERMPVHLVYLVDVSGSMQGPDRLGLAKKSLKLLTETLKPGDTVALCTYAGNTRVVLEPTGIEGKQKILAAIDKLDAGGSTAMASGIDLAYGLASKTLVKGHVNRVVVLSDGDANVGNTSHDQLLKSIAQYKDKGITLSTVGFGSGNYQDTMMEQLADKGDGNYTYIDGDAQAKKVFVDEIDGLLQVVARDVKIQVEFDPTFVKRYRLIGYENRDIADKDFRNDKVDAGEVGAGHSVTALYDVEFADPSSPLSAVGNADSKTGPTSKTKEAKPSKPIVADVVASPVVVRMRSKPAKNTLHGGSDEATETRFLMPSSAIARSFDEAPENYRFAVAVAAFAETLRQSPHAKAWSLETIARMASTNAGGRAERMEMVQMIDKAAKLMPKAPTGSTPVAGK